MLHAAIVTYQMSLHHTQSKLWVITICFTFGTIAQKECNLLSTTKRYAKDDKPHNAKDCRPHQAAVILTAFMLRRRLYLEKLVAKSVALCGQYHIRSGIIDLIRPRTICLYTTCSQSYLLEVAASYLDPIVGYHTMVLHLELSHRKNDLLSTAKRYAKNDKPHNARDCRPLQAAVVLT